ncbi:MAG: AIR synthase-related protein, partial [Gemmatimonadetes bacterium]|nr:AIR synthase-related protein [Gemmatimonadota bacterium]
LTKPLGTGLLATMLKAGTLAAEHAAPLMASMVRLNADAAAVAVALGVRCATDVTGFGLLGHASHLAKASHVTLRFDGDALPNLPGAREAASGGVSTGGATRNASFVKALVRYAASVPGSIRALAVDPQTSGGLLVAVPPNRATEYLDRVDGAVRIGEVLPRQDALLLID